MLTYDDKKHLYTYLGKPVDSVTQVLGKVGTLSDSGWTAVCDSRFFSGYETNQFFGKEFHVVAHLISQGYKPKKDFDYDKQFKPYIKQLYRFIDKYKPVYISGETPLYSKLYKYAGTPDLFCTINDVYYVVDWKTATAFAEYWRMQTAAYVQLEKENNPDIKKKIYHMTVRFSENDFRVDIVKKPTDWYMFLGILNFYNKYKK